MALSKSETKTLYGLVAATVAMALVVCAAVNSFEPEETDLFQQPQSATMLKTDHYVAPNPFEDPELRPKYDVDPEKEKATSKKDFKTARDEVKKGQKIMKDVIKKLTKQDEARDKLMDEAIAISDRIHQVRHLLINLKAETVGIQTHEDTNWVYTNPFGSDADPPAQDLAPFTKEAEGLLKKSKDINKDLKDLIKRAQSSRNDAILLDSELYGEVHKAKVISAEATTEIHHHNDRVEDFNHKDFDIVHPVDAKLNDAFRIEKHRLNGAINLANAISARQPNEVSEVIALATDLLIVNAEGQERLERMANTVDDIKFEREFREKHQ